MNRKFKLILAAILVVVLIASSYAMADDTPNSNESETSSDPGFVFNTEQGSIWILLPKDGDNWRQIPNSDALFTICDARDMITVCRGANSYDTGKTPISSYQVYEKTFDTAEGAFTVTGFVTVIEDATAVIEAVDSFQYTPFGNDDDDDWPEYDVADLDTAGYCTEPDGANVYYGPAADEEIINEVEYEEIVDITGVVMDDLYYSGWLRVNLDGETGYVWGDFFNLCNQEEDPEDDFDPEEYEAQNNYQKVTKSRTLYFRLNNRGVYGARLHVKMYNSDNQMCREERSATVLTSQIRFLEWYTKPDQYAYAEVGVEIFNGFKWMTAKSYDRYDAYVLYDAALRQVSYTCTGTLINKKIQGKAEYYETV